MAKFVSHNGNYIELNSNKLDFTAFIIEAALWSYISLLYGYSMILLYNHSLILLYKIEQTKLSLLY